MQPTENSLQIINVVFCGIICEHKYFIYKVSADFPKPCSTMPISVTYVDGEPMKSKLI